MGIKFDDVANDVQQARNKNEPAKVESDRPYTPDRFHMTVGRAVPMLRQMADEGLRATGGVHPYSRQFKEGVAVMHGCTHALIQLSRPV